MYTNALKYMLSFWFKKEQKNSEQYSFMVIRTYLSLNVKKKLDFSGNIKEQYFQRILIQTAYEKFSYN